MTISDKKKLEIIKEKIYFSLTFDELVFIKKYIAKHGYNITAKHLLSFDMVALVKRADYN